jgi:hypothetical protein
MRVLRGFAFIALICLSASLARAQNDLGSACSNDRDCISNYCADGRFCAPRDGTGQPGQYCHHDNHCASSICNCPGDRHTGGRAFCSNWESRTGANRGTCAAKRPNSVYCNRNEQCESGHCAEEICAPVDGAGLAGDYCHHGNHCRSGVCICPPCERTRGFCPDFHEALEVLVSGATITGECAPDERAEDRSRVPNPMPFVYTAQDRSYARSRSFRVGETVIVKVQNNSRDSAFYVSVSIPEIFRGEDLVVQRSDGGNWVNAVDRIFIDAPTHHCTELLGGWNSTRKWTSNTPGTYRVELRYNIRASECSRCDPRSNLMTVYSDTFELTP